MTSEILLYFISLIPFHCIYSFSQYPFVFITLPAPSLFPLLWFLSSSTQLHSTPLHSTPLHSTPLHFLPILSIQHSHPFNSSYSINSHIQQKNLFVPIHRWQQLNTYPVWRYLSPTGLLWITRHPQLTGGPSPLELFVCMCMNVCMWVHACMCIFVWVCVCLHSCLCVISGREELDDLWLGKEREICYGLNLTAGVSWDHK